MTTTESARSAIRSESLVRRFGEVTAVDGVDLDVASGEIYGFLGPNGAGKSTTVRMLCTLLAPTSGRATVAGYDVATDPGAVRLRIGVALQVGELGELSDLADALDLPISTYSGGMRRRLDLAAALVHNPDLLFLDEPTTGLDPISRARVWEEVRRLNTELGMTIFLTTQYLEEADTLADRVGIIAAGKIVAEGTPAELKHSIGTDVIIVRVEDDGAALCPILENVPGVLSVEARGSEIVVSTGDGSATVSPVAVALSACEVKVRDLTLRTTSLDDVFLELTGSHIRQHNGDQEVES
jgi:ABC-2 type transport system ATP-binding protein